MKSIRLLYLRGELHHLIHLHLKFFVLIMFTVLNQIMLPLMRFHLRWYHSHLIKQLYHWYNRQEFMVNLVHH